MLIRIVAGHFVAGVETLRISQGLSDGVSEYHNRCAPIVKYMKKWSPYRIKQYCTSKNWLYQPILEKEEKNWYAIHN